jgi:hypothetical protein
MKKFMLGTLIMIAGVLSLAAGACAETGAVVIHINQDFIAGGKTFSAGTYKVNQGSPQTGSMADSAQQRNGSLGLPSSQHARLGLSGEGRSEAEASGKRLLPERSRD